MAYETYTRDKNFQKTGYARTGTTCVDRPDVAFSLDSVQYWHYGYVMSFRGPRQPRTSVSTAARNRLPTSRKGTSSASKSKRRDPHNFELYRFNTQRAAFGGYSCVPGGSTIQLSDGRLLRRYSATPENSWFQPLSAEDLHDRSAALRQQAINAVFAEANAPSLELGTMLAEAKETVKYVFERLLSLKAILVKLLSGDIKVTDWASAWLEYRYAIMPLILDVSSIIEAFKGGEQILQYDASKRLTNVLDVENSLPFGGEYLHVKGTLREEVSASARINVLSQCDPAPLGTGIWDVLRTGWELVTLSFVVDWFIGVGDWLTSLRDTKLKIQSSYVTTVMNAKLSDLTVAPGGQYDHHYSALPPITHYHMKRSIDIAPSMIPALNATNLSLFRTIDATALIISFLTSFFKWRS